MALTGVEVSPSELFLSFCELDLSERGIVLTRTEEFVPPGSGVPSVRENFLSLRPGIASQGDNSGYFTGNVESLAGKV